MMSQRHSSYMRGGPLQVARRHSPSRVIGWQGIIGLCVGMRASTDGTGHWHAAALRLCRVGMSWPMPCQMRLTGHRAVPSNAASSCDGRAGALQRHSLMVALCPLHPFVEHKLCCRPPLLQPCATVHCCQAGKENEWSLSTSFSLCLQRNKTFPIAHPSPADPCSPNSMSMSTGQVETAALGSADAA